MKNYTITTKNGVKYEVEFSRLAKIQIEEMSFSEYMVYTTMLGIVDKFTDTQREAIVLDEVFRKSLYVRVDQGDIKVITIVSVVGFEDTFIRRIEVRRMIEIPELRFSVADMR